MSTEIEQLQLDKSDTISTIRERLAHIRGRRVLLIFPDDLPKLRRKLDLVLIQREAYRRAIQLAIVTTEPALVFYANELNISSFDSIEASEQRRWKRGRHKVFLPRYHKPSPELEPEDLQFIASRLARHNQRSPWRVALERVLVLALLLVTVAVALYVILPGATVELSLQEDEVAVLADIIADRKVEAIDQEQGIVPAQTIRETVETTVTVPTSGSFWLDSVSAAGLVTFTNLTDLPVKIPPNTILGTSAGEPILFETVAEVLVPAGPGQSVDASIEAMEAYRGSLGNVGAGMINTVFGALTERVSVINLAPAVGGGNRSVKTVAEEDKARLLASARIQLQSLAFEKIRARLPESQVIIIESIQIAEERKEWTNFSADIGTMTSELSLTMRAVVSALAVDERYGRQVALARLQAEVPAGKTLLKDSVQYARGAFNLSRSNGQVSFEASASGTVIAALDDDELRQSLAGISLENAIELLKAREEISTAPPPRLSIYPRGLQQMPLLPIRIQVRVENPA